MRKDVKLALIGAGLLAASYGSAAFTPEQIRDPTTIFWVMTTIVSFFGSAITLVLAAATHFGALE